MVLDAAHGRTVLFGGFGVVNGSGQRVNDTWLWDGRAWSQASPSSSPSARVNPSAAYSPAWGKVVLFGGQGDAGTGLADTWTWDGTGWTQVATPTSPPARDHATMAWSPALGKIVMFGGWVRNGNTVSSYLGDTWTFDGTTWAPLAGDAPSERAGATLTLDEHDGSLLLFGGLQGSGWSGETWRLTGSTWTQAFPAHSPPARVDAAAGYDPVLHRVVVYGGTDANDYFGDLRLWTGADWAQATAYVGAGQRQQPMLAGTPAHGHLMLFGGFVGSSVFGDTQVLDYGGVGAPYTYDTHAVSDQTTVGVNLTSGNVHVAATDIRLPGLGGDLVIGRDFNSRLGGQFAFGANWTSNVGGDVSVSPLPDGSAVVFGLGGGDAAFYAASGSAFTTPPGVDADLTRNAGGTLTLTGHRPLRRWQFTTGGQLSSEADANGNTVGYAYNPDGSLDHLTDAQGRQTSYSYDPAGLLTLITEPDGTPHRYGYDGNHNLVWADNGDGKRTQYFYDAAHLMSKIVDPSGNPILINNNSDSTMYSLVRVTDETAQTGPTSYYDSVAVTSRPDPAVTDALLSDPNGNQTRYSADDRGGVLRAQDALGHSRDTSFTPAGQVATVNANNVSAVFSSTYDSLGNRTKSQAPGATAGATGASSSATYPGGTAGLPGSYLPSSQTDSAGNCTSSSYDAAGNLTDSYAGQTGGSSGCTGQTGGVHLTYRYQGRGGVSCGAQPGQLCSSIDGKGQSTSYAYDSHGNLTTITPPAPLGVTHVNIDYQTGLLFSVTDGRGVTTTITYDGAYRRTIVNTNAAADPGCTSAATCVRYGYDLNGNLTERHDASGVTYYAYTARNTPFQTTLPDGTSSQVGYDPNGNIYTATDPTGTINYGYDTVNRLTSLAEPGGNCGSTPAKCTSFGYDSDGNRTSVSFPNGVVQTNGYDQAGRQTTMTGKKSTTTIVSRTYTYANTAGTDTGLRSSVTDQAGSTTAYGYDSRSQLTSAVVKNSAGSTTASYAYGYDNNGNRTSGPEGNHSYNPAGQLTDTGYSYDNAGNTLTGGGRSFAYNNYSQNTSVTSAGTTTPMGYADSSNTQRTSAGPTSFLNSLLGLASSTTSGSTLAFTREPSGNLVSLRTGGSSSYYLLDALGSVLALTGPTGTTTANYSYDPYGKTLTSTGTQASLNPYRFVSGYTDSSNLVKFGLRYYDPSLGRFTQVDPTGLDAGYVYAGNSPVTFVDPSGAEEIATEGGGGGEGSFGFNNLPPRPIPLYNGTVQRVTPNPGPAEESLAGRGAVSRYTYIAVRLLQALKSLLGG